MRALETQTVEVEAGMAVRQSEVKNLEIELHTLQSTVTQLERQQGEAGRRLANLDAQKEALERTRRDLTGKLSSDEAEISTVKSELESSSTSAVEMEDVLNRKREELQNLREEENRMEVKLQMEKANLDTQAQHHGGTETSIQQAESGLRALQTSTSLMQSTLIKLEALLANPDGYVDERILDPVERPTLPGSLIPAPGGNKWLQSGYQANTWATKPTRPPPPSSLYDAVPDASTSADPFQSNGGDAFGTVDPFTAGVTAPDPFGEEDPFASTGGSNGDPFGASDPFASSNGAPHTPQSDPFGSGEVKKEPLKKPPPPRPAPPKSRSGTPASGSATPDPFGAEDPFGGGGDTTTDFGNFADFGKFT